MKNTAVAAQQTATSRKRKKKLRAKNPSAAVVFPCVCVDAFSAGEGVEAFEGDGEREIDVEALEVGEEAV